MYKSIQYEPVLSDCDCIHGSQFVSTTFRNQKFKPFRNAYGKRRLFPKIDKKLAFARLTIWIEPLGLVIILSKRFF